jgi:hypothetical protein
MTRDEMLEQQTRLVQLAKVLESDLMKTPGVIGLGVGLRSVGGKTTDELCFRVYVERKLPPQSLDPNHRIPETLGNVPTDVIEYKPVTRKRFSETSSGDVYHRPLQGGYKITTNAKGADSGTLGIVAQTNSDNPQYVVLSNAHVLYSGKGGDGTEE